MVFLNTLNTHKILVFNWFNNAHDEYVILYTYFFKFKLLKTNK